MSIHVWANNSKETLINYYGVATSKTETNQVILCYVQHSAHLYLSIL